jgi:hypothetical protein
MSIMAGKADRFSSKANPPGNGQEPVATETQVKTPAPPDAFRGLQVGPEAGMEWEAPTARTVDGSRPDLRLLSPFILRVEPPAILGELSGDPTHHQVAKGDLFTSAYVGSSAFVHARKALQGAPDNDLPYGAGAAEVLVKGGEGTLSDKKVTEGKINVPTNGKGNPGRLGQPAIADVWTALDIATQLKAVKSTPPLVLLINPTTMSKSFTKLQQFTERTRFGYVFQAWGEEQPTMSITARCGAFISGGRGVQWASRRDSASWQNLVGAFHFYRNNGYIYDTVGKSNAHLMVGALSIHYDGWIYYGHMSSFSYAFNEQNTKGGIEFSLDFTISAMVDTAQQTTLISPMRPPNPDPKSARFQNSGGGDAPGGIGLNIFGGDPEVISNYAKAPTSPDGTSQAAQVSKQKAGNEEVVVAKNSGGFEAPPDKERKIPEGGNAVPFDRGHA